MIYIAHCVITFFHNINENTNGIECSRYLAMNTVYVLVGSSDLPDIVISRENSRPREVIVLKRILK